MSGGSFDYLCHAYDLTDLSFKTYALNEMVEALKEVAPDHPVTAYTARVFALLTETEVPEEVREVWKAMEWQRSGDWGQDQRDEVLARHAAWTEEP